MITVVSYIYDTMIHVDILTSTWIYYDTIIIECFISAEPYDDMISDTTTI